MDLFFDATARARARAAARRARGACTSTSSWGCSRIHRIKQEQIARTPLENVVLAPERDAIVLAGGSSRARRACLASTRCTDVADALILSRLFGALCAASSSSRPRTDRSATCTATGSTASTSCPSSRRSTRRRRLDGRAADRTARRRRPRPRRTPRRTPAPPPPPAAPRPPAAADDARPRRRAAATCGRTRPRPTRGSTRPSRGSAAAAAAPRAEQRDYELRVPMGRSLRVPRASSPTTAATRARRRAAPSARRRRARVRRAVRARRARPISRRSRRNFDAVVLGTSPRLSAPATRARRFITLVDELYEARALLCARRPRGRPSSSRRSRPRRSPRPPRSRRAAGAAPRRTLSAPTGAAGRRRAGGARGG